MKKMVFFYIMKGSEIWVLYCCMELCASAQPGVIKTMGCTIQHKMK